LFDLLSRLRDPAIFQGNLKKRNYYEGWYFKQVDPRGVIRLSVIPGISLTEKDNHAFVQVFDGLRVKSHYVSYPIESFKPEKDPFGIRIGDNRFSLSGMELNIEGDVSVNGSLSYSDNSLFQGSWIMRGIMGRYGYVPFLETYHGLVSMDHTVNGSVTINGEKQIFNGAHGYIEKDWGASFPQSWIWMQGNCFIEEKTSLMISIAVIPWLGSSFIGHIAVFRVNGEILNLSTYSGGKITKLEKTVAGVKLKIETRKYALLVNSVGGEVVNLKSPEKGVMTGRTVESLSSTIEVSLHNKSDNRLLFKGISSGAGLEVMDERELLIKGLKLR
jgi:tocopherol cyclase